MRGGILAVSALSVCFFGCATVPPPPAPSPVPIAKPVDSPTDAPSVKSDPTFRLPAEEARPVPETVPGGGGLKGEKAGVRAVKAEGVRKDPAFVDVLKAQQDLAARLPHSDDEKLRLALLLASAKQYEEAEQVLTTVKSRTSPLATALDFVLRRQLGDHKEAGRLLAEYVDEERRATGFLVERAVHVSRVRRYRDYTPTESDRVPPGGDIHLYVEPRHFTLSKAADKWVIHLRYEWKLFDDRQRDVPVPAWEKASVEEREDRVLLSGPIAEFYQSFHLPLPLNLALGSYRVQVTVTDVASGKSDKALIPVYVTPVERGR